MFRIFYSRTRIEIRGEKIDAGGKRKILEKCMIPKKKKEF
jgi:hypothetical protein